MDVVNQVNDFADDAEQLMKKAAKTDAVKTATRISERVERIVSDKPANAVWRAALLGLAGIATASSLGFAVLGKKHHALVAAQWVPALLLAALWGQVIRD